MKIYDERDNIYDAVDAVVKHGIAVIEGVTTSAVAYSEAVIKCLDPYNEIAPVIGYQNVPNNGYLYYVFDCNKFTCGDQKLKQLVFEIDKKS